MQELHHLSRYEKKRLVKGWHSTRPSNVTRILPSEEPSEEPSEDSHITNSGSMRSLFVTPPGALDYETHRTITWRSTSNSTDDCLNDHDVLHNQQQDEKLPKTVAQVKHAYRTRARKEEERDATKAIRKREMLLELRKGPRRKRESKTKELHQQQVTLDVIGKADNEENQDNVILDAPQHVLDGELQLLNLPVDEILTNVAYRSEVLRQIRHKLSCGSEILLQSDCPNVKETVNNTRLMLQMLCTQSLAYCVRDQNVVPEIINSLQSTTRLALHLLPRHQPI